LSFFIKSPQIFYQISTSYGVHITCDLIISGLNDTKKIDDELNELATEMDVVSEKANKMVSENAFKAQSQDEYAVRYNSLCQRYDSCKKKADELNAEKVKNAIKAQEIADFRKAVESHDEPIAAWDQSIWNAAVDEALVHSDNTIEFRFYSGVSVIEKII
jgi:predicted nuclease with TOPRIM domain